MDSPLPLFFPPARACLFRWAHQHQQRVARSHLSLPLSRLCRALRRAAYRCVRRCGLRLFVHTTNTDAGRLACLWRGARRGFVAKVGLVSRADSATAAVPLHAATRARRLIGSRTLREFQQCALAFSCGACGEPGAAMRQCAACAALLCFECCVRCADDEPDRLIEGGRGYVFQRAATGRSKRCAFALCRSCDASLSLRRVDGAAPIHRDDLFDMPAPGLSAPLCSGCASRPDPWWARERARCLAHVNACICYCAKWDTCHEEMCTHDCDGSPSLLNCHKSFTFISSFACGDANQRHLGLCSKPGCPGCYCSECYPALTCL